MPNYVPDPDSFQMSPVAPGPDAYFTGGYSPPQIPTAEGEANLIDIIRDGISISVYRKPGGSVSLDILPRTMANPPNQIRLFGALYRRVDAF